MSTTPTSASERYEAARRALDLHENRSERATNAQMHLAEALRALIQPPATAETVDEIADRLVDLYAAETCHGDELQMVRGVIEDAVRAGIQAAWESWESEAAPTIDDNTDLIEDLRQIRDQRGDWRGVLDSLIGEDE